MPTTALTDEQLVVIIRETNSAVFSEVIKRYQGKLSHYLRKFVHDADDLEDVLQIVFIKTYRNLFDFDVSRKFSSWIYRIAHNEAINHLKKNRRPMVSLDESEWQIVDEKIDIKGKVDLALAQTVISEGLLELKDNYRQALILYFFEQKTYEEISEILRLPRNTVGTLISRGKNLLKNFLEKKSYGK